MAVQHRSKSDQTAEPASADEHARGTVSRAFGAVGKLLGARDNVDVRPASLDEAGAAEARPAAPEAPAAPPVLARTAADRNAMIAVAAYLKAQARGFVPGGELDDWLAAEEEVDTLLNWEEVRG